MTLCDYCDVIRTWSGDPVIWSLSANTNSKRGTVLKHVAEHWLDFENSVIFFFNSV